ncbi:MAG: extracellular solute-binding protein [Chloroflexi bacterium]|nr:extracellular solute-binding protein [Chloroflexota bacterium]
MRPSMVGVSRTLLGSLLILGVLSACAPKAAPAPSTPAPPARLPVSTPTSNLPLPTSQEAAWAKVVEAAKKEGGLTMYSFNLVGDVGVAVSRGFKERYGISLDIITGRGAEFVERLKTEKRMGKVVADAADGSSLHLMNMKAEGLTISVVDQSPVFSEQGVWAANVFSMDPKDKHLAGLSLNYWSPWINTKQVTAADVPQVWRDLLKPQFKGKMVLTDPTTSGGPQQFFVPLMRERVVDEEYLRALYKQDLLLSASLPDEGRLLARGERPISVRGSIATLAKFAAEGAPIKAIDMRDGVVQLVSPVTAIIAGAPHPNAARLFMNWFLSKEGQAVYTKASGAPPIRRDVADPSPEAARLTPQKAVLQTLEDNDKANQYFKDRWLDKLWGR